MYLILTLILVRALPLFTLRFISNRKLKVLVSVLFCIGLVLFFSISIIQKNAGCISLIGDCYNSALPSFIEEMKIFTNLLYVALNSVCLFILSRYLYLKYIFTSINDEKK